MVKFTYNIECRNCSHVKENSFLTAMGVNESECIGLTEFEVSLFLDKSFLENGIVCKACGSENIETFDIGLEYGDKFYDYNKLANSNKQRRIELLQILISKKNGRLEFETGGEREIDGQFFSNSLQLIKTVVSNRGKIFHSKSNGSLFACISGHVNINTRRVEAIKIERFRTMGLSKNDVIDSVNKFLRENFK